MSVLRASERLDPPADDAHPATSSVVTIETTSGDETRTVTVLTESDHGTLTWYVGADGLIHAVEHQEWI